MQKNWKKHPEDQNCWYFHVISALKLRNDKNCQKYGSLNRNFLNFLYRYGIFWMSPGESSCPGGSEYVWQMGIEGVLGWVRGGRSLPYFQKKNCKYSVKKQIRPQFSKYCFQNKSTLGHKLWQAADSFWNRYFENCGRICFFEHLIILLTDLILLQSPNFGRPKQGQTVSFGQPNSV